MRYALRMAMLLIAAALAMTAAGCAFPGWKPGEGDTGGSSDTGDGITRFTVAVSANNNKAAEAGGDLSDSKWVRKLEQYTHTDLTYRVLPTNQFEQKLSLMFASSDIPDVTQGFMPTDLRMDGSMETGLFKPLDELLEKYGPNLLKNVPKEAWESVTYKGHIYAVPQYLSNPARRTTFIRSDLLKKTGLPRPQTMDDVLNVLRAFKKLGVEQPYQMRESFKYADLPLAAYDVLPAWEWQGDRAVPKFFKADMMMKALQTYKTMYDERLISKEFATINPTMFTNMIYAGKSGMWTGNAASLTAFNSQLRLREPSAAAEAIPSRFGPDGGGGYTLYAPVITAFYVSRHVSETKAAGIIRFFDWMLTKEAETFFSLGIEGDTFLRSGGTVVPVATPDTARDHDMLDFLHLVKDGTYGGVRLRLEQSEDGRRTADLIDNVLTKEGRSQLVFTPELAAAVKYPELAMNIDQYGKFILDHMIRMIYGKEAIDQWPSVIEEWMNKGGAEMVKEATDRYRRRDGVLEVKPKP